MNGPLSGLRAWLVQRVTAVLVLLFLVSLGGALLVSPRGGADAWRAWVGAPAIRVGLALGALVLGLHAWVGMRDIVLDYVHHTGVRLTILVLVLLALGAQGLWLLFVLGRVS